MSTHRPLTTDHHPTNAGDETPYGAAGNGTMPAVIRRRYGPVGAVTLATVPRPEPGPGQVLIRVVAAGVDRGVIHLATGLPYPVRLAGFGFRRPTQPVLGGDVAGVVEAVGAGVDAFGPGDEVFGVASGSYATHTTADAARVALKPAAVPFETAAATPVSGVTALQAVTEVGGLSAGQRVLVLGASGGVGSFAVQIAAHLGGHVTGVAGPAKQDLVRTLGVEEVIDHSTTDVTDLPTRYDLIIDTGGLTPIRRLRRILEPRGTLVIVGGESGGRLTGGAGRQFRALALSPFVGPRLTTFIADERAELVETLGRLLASGVVTVPVGRRYRLEQATEALSDLAAGRIAGKAVIVVEPAVP
ncbi:MAG: NAD(P)-dependent alcohol dehydrogenase [Acidimicrobiales bacterium]